MNAIELFGGKAAAIEKMTRAVREKLVLTNFATLYKMEELFRLNTQTLINVVMNNQNVDYALFDVIGPALKLTIHDVLGRPDLSNPDAAKHWKRQMVESPLQLVGSANNSAPDSREMDIELYVTSRAIEELNAMGDVHCVSQA